MASLQVPDLLVTGSYVYVITFIQESRLIYNNDAQYMTSDGESREHSNTEITCPRRQYKVVFLFAIYTKTQCGFDTHIMIISSSCHSPIYFHLTKIPKIMPI